MSIRLWSLSSLLWLIPFSASADDFCGEPGFLDGQRFEGAVFGRRGVSLVLGPYLTLSVSANRKTWLLNIVDTSQDRRWLHRIEPRSTAPDSTPRRDRSTDALDLLRFGSNSMHDLRPLRFSFRNDRHLLTAHSTQPAVVPDPGAYGRGWIQLSDLAWSPREERIVYFRFVGCLAWNR